MKGNTAPPRRPIAVCPICNHGGYEILSIECRPEGEFVEIALNDGEKQVVLGFRKITYREFGGSYFKVMGERLLLDDFIRLSQ